MQIVMRRVIEWRDHQQGKSQAMPKFAAGVVKFQQEVFPGNAVLFEKLAEGQAPEALFIPAQILGSKRAC